MPFLIKFERNWADEFDVSGFVALPEQEWEEYKIKFREIVRNSKFEYYFGTNQSIEWNGTDEYLNDFKVSEISSDEYNFLLKNFSRVQFDDWDGKTFKSKKEIVIFGNIPFYSNTDLSYLKEEIEERKKDIY